MPTYTRSITLKAGADRVFNYLSDVGNLPEYFDRLDSARPVGGQANPDAVQVSADVNGKEVAGEAWFRVDRTANRVEWGSEDDSDYRGRLDVTAQQDRSLVRLELTTPHGGDEVEQGLDATLDHVRRILETDGAGD
ncbi:SRPBCC family protein [Actinokineospora bangkokensis]|uniref:Polyketide cyclase n=1 Tax=Actinokineospora bangkokensis TaxID=1193682 RepID=A0A1Q9LPX7_9PSEU|nr:SRPBCC family protein [Actinokineospora bangkokensis]OLR94051.1 hypothetical protein BJP25_13835 [Actinokineospora bangkokensis]